MSEIYRLNLLPHRLQLFYNPTYIYIYYIFNNIIYILKVEISVTLIDCNKT